MDASKIKKEASLGWESAASVILFGNHFCVLSHFSSFLTIFPVACQAVFGRLTANRVHEKMQVVAPNGPGMSGNRPAAPTGVRLPAVNQSRSMFK
jgi:hypothetical protein